MFDRVYVINATQRVDRLHAFYRRLQQYGWPFRWPTVYRAIIGDKVGVPAEFTQGGGAYGCRMSHLRILQDCLMDDVASVLILEDDAEIAEGFPARALEFLAKVPDDWEGIMFGGQHHAPPMTTNIPGVVRVRYCQRTHAYAARPAYMRALQQRWGNAIVHIDWLMRDWQHMWRVYAPEPWLIGQAGGRSDIRGAEKPPEWWIRTTSCLAPGPVAIALVERDIMDDLRARGCHIGMTRNEAGVDVGLERLFRENVDEDVQVRELRAWLEMIQAESVGGLLPTIWHPAATPELVRAAWTGPVYVLCGSTAEEALGCLPQEIRERMAAGQTLRKSPIILLRCPPDMIDDLHAHGYHPGYWRHRTRKLDNGLIRIMETLPESVRVEELRKWCTLLCEQADRAGMIVVAAHPALTVDLLRQATDRQVIEVSANTCDELRQALIGPTYQASVTE